MAKTKCPHCGKEVDTTPGGRRVGHRPKGATKDFCQGSFTQGGK